MTHVRPQEVVVRALAASDAGVGDAENARRHGVAITTIRRWHRENQTRGRPRGQDHLLALCPRCDGAALEGPAYAELLGWYLGDGYLSTGRRGVYNLHICNDVTYPVVNAHIQDVMRRVKPRSRPHTRGLPGSLATTVSWKHWPCLFPQHGPRRKHERDLVLADWRRTVVEEHPGDFLRGLFHSDGARVRNWATRTVGASAAATTTPLAVRRPLRGHPRLLRRGPGPRRRGVTPVGTVHDLGLAAGRRRPPRRPGGPETVSRWPRRRRPGEHHVDVAMTTSDGPATLGRARASDPHRPNTCPDQSRATCFDSDTNGPDA